MSSTDYTFQGWLGKGPDSVEGKMVWEQYEPKTWSESDVDIKITHCGICGSDIHTLRSGWGPTLYPCCVGHEIVGHAVRVGKNVEKGIKVGDRVGIGAQSSSCLRPECEECAAGMENHCQRMVGTYNGKYPDGSKSYGGYADYARAPSHFVIKIPDAIPSAEAAPMLCGGVTVYAPLKKNGCGPGKKVGIVGIGGLGHFGLLFAKALGADKVVAISRTGAKKEDAKKMGADDFIATDEDKRWAKTHARSLDLIISTVSSPKMPLMDYLSLLRTNGQFIQVGAPEDPIPAFSAFALIGKGVKIGGSMIGAPHEIDEMLQLAAEKGVKPWIQERPLKEANQAVVDMDAGKARYRICLVNETHAKL
ncbi:hypothetical protein H2199_002571 [Coniosporium tulheliwenetii]|uniref:Uncharacterized protein n=1 Tax=Coniosporium tulheliwenetii TaxID=3383036 RepID=A0ACC2ZGH1_9PEZI|nr:hypothetical protein H2199_002571 [Cladosporium sp. JES 115]